ncbi:hypothetical protein CEP54_002418 [Fusarium duplospermum]|uniref:Protein kinase domain-containing protein n=1 Tax=Fusarium duplospermum TaxID=1325734 RepID=A0A428QV33_9HYPO|nr:hypothetical protein CEP54_002418 [Fusarium duplospermum]
MDQQREPPLGGFRSGIEPPEDSSKEPVFELVKEIGTNLWIATRRGDARGEQFLASPSPFAIQPSEGSDEAHQEAKALHKLLSKHNQAYTIRQLLNHENLVSIVGSLEHQTFTKTQERDEQRSTQLLVWDFCDAANLTAVFQQYPTDNSSYYLPESLCWHVLRSLTRAVAYLHDGKRLYFDANLSPDDMREWVSVDTDWFPILHRRIEPDNIYFQHPRGTELYGQCKLGNFNNVAVTCHTVSDENLPYTDQIARGMALTTREGTVPLNHARKLFKMDPALISEGIRGYTLGDEMWSIGSVIFTMMTGLEVNYYCDICGCSHVFFCQRDGCLEHDAADNGCECLYGGCKHLSKDGCREEITRWTRCGHNCQKPKINVHTYMARAWYTKTLRSLVKDLLLYDPQLAKNPWARADEFAQIVEVAYQEWKRGTEEGRYYVDIDDDMAARFRRAREEEAESSMDEDY